MNTSGWKSNAHSDEEMSLLRSPRRSNVKTTPSKSSVESPKSVDILTYQDIQITNTDESEYFIEHHLSCDAPIYQQTEFQSLSLKQQVQVLCSFHTKVLKNINAHSRLQVESVPFPKLIGPSGKYSDSSRRLRNDSEDENSNIRNFDATSPTSDEYVSRSGRVTKRKLYSESNFSPSDSSKKFKILDADWQADAKTSPSASKTTSRKKNIPDKELNTSEQKCISKKNLDIVSRSSLFKDREPSSRLTKIAEGVERKTLESAIDEKKIENFERMLNNSDKTTENIDSNGPCKTIVSPTTRRQGRGSRQAVNQLNDSGKDHQIADSSKEEPMSCSPSTSKRSNEKMVCCPICENEFANSKIEEHASSCGETRSIKIS